MADEFTRSDAMMEGTRLLIENLREKVADMEERCEQMDREKKALGDLLSSKKKDYENMKDHYLNSIDTLEDEVQRLKSEKSRLLDKLQLPESERNSLALEENEIAELKRKLEESESKSSEQTAENEDLRQEIRDLQLEMEEIHDRFRDDERAELRELQRELEGTAKNCRIMNFKLRKAERKVEQCEVERTQMEEKLKNLESCFQGSDDKRRIRVLEEDLRTAKEVSVRLHDELERVEERRGKSEEELEINRTALRESEIKLKSLQIKLEAATQEHVGSKTSSSELTRLSRDLRESMERESVLRDRLQATERETKTLRRSLSDSTGELNRDSAFSRQTLGRAGSRSKLDLDLDDSLDSSVNSEQELKTAKKRIEELQQDNDNLLCAVKYLRNKMEQRDTRCATPIVESKSTKDVLSRLSSQEASLHSSSNISAAADANIKRLEKELKLLKDSYEDLELENMRLISDNQRLKTASTLNKPQTLDDEDDVVESKAELVMRVKKLEDEKANLKSELGALKDKTSRLFGEVADLKKTSSSTSSSTFSHKLPTTLYGLEEECRRLKVRVVEMEVENSQLSDEMKVLRETTSGKEEAQLKDKIDQLQSEKNDLSSTIDQLTGELEASREDMDKMLDTKQERELTITKELEQLKRKNGELSDMLETSVEKADMAEKKLDQLTSQHSDLQGRTEELERSLSSEKTRGVETREKEAELRSTNEQLSAEVAALKNENDRMKLTLEETKQEFSGKMDATHKELELVTKRLNDCKEELSTTQSELASSRAEYDSTKEDLKLVKEEYKLKKKELKATKDELKATREELGVATESLAKSKDEYRNVKDEYKANKKEFKAFKEEMKGVKEELRVSREETKCLTDELTEAYNELKASKDELERLHEENKKTKGEIKSNAQELKLHSNELTVTKEELKKSKEEIKKYKDEISKKSKEVEKANETVRTVNDEIQEIQKLRVKTIDELNDYKEQLKQAKLSHIATKNELKALEDEAEASKEDASKVTEECDEIKNDLRKTKEEARKTKGELERAQVELQKSKDDQQKLKDENKEMKEELRSVRDDVKILKEDLQTTTNGCRKAKEEVQPVKESLKRATEDLRRSQEECDAAKDSWKKTKEELSSVKEEIKRVKEELSKANKDSKVKSESLQKSYDELKRESDKTTKELLRCQDDLKMAKEFKSKFESLQKSYDNLKRENEKLLVKEKEKSKVTATPVVQLKDREPVTWKQEKQDLEKQIKEYKSNLDSSTAELKKLQSKPVEDTNNKTSKLEQNVTDLEKVNIDLTQSKKLLEAKIDKLNEEIKELKIEKTSRVEKQAEEIKRNDSTLVRELEEQKEERRKISKDLEIAVKRQEEAEKNLAKEIETAARAKSDMQREKNDFDKKLEYLTMQKADLETDLKTLRQRHESTLKQKEEEWNKEKDKLCSSKEENGIREKDTVAEKIKQQLKEKEKELAEKDKSVKKLTETSENKETEIKSLKAEKERADFQIKNLNDRINSLLAKLESIGSEHRKLIADLNIKKQSLEVDLDRVSKENDAMTSDLKDARDRLTRHEEACAKEKGKLEVELRMAQESLKKTSSFSMGTSYSSPGAGPKKDSTQQNSSLVDENTKLKAELAESGRQRCIERYDLQKVISDKTKTIEENKAYTERLKTDIEKLRIQVADLQKSGSGASSPTRVITIPIQKDRPSNATIPIQLASGGSGTHLGTEAASSAESLAFEAERQVLLQRIRMGEDYKIRYMNTDKSLEELNSKVKVLENKNKELENKLKIQESVWKMEKACLGSGSEDGKSEVPKMSDIRSKFEKFGGATVTQRPVRKPEGAAGGAAPGDVTVNKAVAEAKGLAQDLQRQLLEAEKMRVAERQELLNKIEKQRKDFEAELQNLKFLQNRAHSRTPERFSSTAQVQFQSSPQGVSSPTDSDNSFHLSSPSSPSSGFPTGVSAPSDRLRTTLVVPIRKASVEPVTPEGSVKVLNTAEDRMMARRIVSTLKGIGSTAAAGNNGNVDSTKSTNPTIVRVTAGPRTQVQVNRVPTERPGFKQQ